MSDVLMTANPSLYEGKEVSCTTQWLSKSDFLGQEELVKAHDAVLWQAFRTHGKYQHTVQKADFFAVAVDEGGHYLASAFVVVLGKKWLIEYVMADPEKQGKGAGTAVMNRIMQEARRAEAEVVILNCDPEKEDGKLPIFYGKFGFQKVGD